MEFGRIRRESRPITAPEWKEIIASDASLEPMPGRTGVNPFTSEPVTSSGEGGAIYRLKGEKAGNAVLENGEILTTGICRDVCDRIASVLGATVLVDDRS
jgi:hypothetical protein